MTLEKLDKSVDFVSCQLMNVLSKLYRVMI